LVFRPLRPLFAIAIAITIGGAETETETDTDTAFDADDDFHFDHLFVKAAQTSPGVGVSFIFISFTTILFRR